MLTFQAFIVVVEEVAAVVVVVYVVVVVFVVVLYAWTGSVSKKTTIYSADLLSGIGDFSFKPCTFSVFLNPLSSIDINRNNQVKVLKKNGNNIKSFLSSYILFF